MADLERARIKVGFIPIIDCAAIVLAEELAAYERQGLEVEIRREVSWANVSPTASIAPTSTGPRRATWESNAPMPTACRRAATASRL
jgi:nitrate/nitrite transport system substrate-binding protein